MKIQGKKFIFYIVAALMASLVFSSSDALAVGAAYFPQDTTVNLTIGGNSTNFTIVSESDADSVVAKTNSIAVTMSSGQSFKIKSSEKKKLTNDGGFKVKCDSAESSITATVTTTTTFNITPSADACTSTGGGAGGGGSTGGGTGGGGGTTYEATPAPTPVSTSVSTPISTPISTPVSQPTTSVVLAKPSDYKLKEGDIVGAASAGDPDIYIINEFGFKRLFLNPVIFNFYGHLGGFSKVKKVAPIARDAFIVSGLFRNCETNDQKVYGVETTGEDTGTLHWVNTTGSQAVADDPNFFKKVFCINNNEFKWYKQGTPYTSVNQIPAYSRKTAVAGPVSTPTPTPKPTSIPTVATSGKLKVIATIAWLNVRDKPSTSGNTLAKILPNQQFDFSEVKDGWYKIQKNGEDWGWVFGKYIIKI